MRALFICGSVNQTRMMHQIAAALPQFQCFFTPYYCDGFYKLVQRLGGVEWSVMGGRFLKKTLAYLAAHRLAVDHEGKNGPYDLVITCSDIIVPRNVRGTRLVLVQEGMTDPEGITFFLVRRLGFPRWMATTAGTGLSDAYDLFCVASEGFRDLFIGKGVKPEKLRVTGIPNFDHCQAFLDNDFPHRDYVLVATSDRRETFKYENRAAFIRKARDIAGGRPLLFKFHPNEDAERARREVERHAPDALTYADGNTDHMIANCQALVTRYSSVVFVAMALGKELHSDLPAALVRRLMPIQNGGRSAQHIAAECLRLFG